MFLVLFCVGTQLLLGLDAGVGFWFYGSGQRPASAQKVILLLCLLTVKPPIPSKLIQEKTARVMTA
jgi:hypothetical protein